MPEILRHHSLKRLNTFHLDVKADYFASCRSLEEIRSVLKDPLFQHQRKLILGGGSNILFTGDFKGFVLHPAIMGREITAEDRKTLQVHVGAGENWDDFVDWSTQWGLGGIENLSLIPGSVGSGPIQNIGAYGVEVSQVVGQVHAVDLETGKKLVFENESCRFGYRSSIFKGEWKNRCIITSVVFSLLKKPRLNMTHPQVAETMAEKDNQDVKTLREVIIGIRRSKLPDPDELSNAGSFFKNPVIPRAKVETLQKDFPGIPFYPATGGNRKIPAAWLIEQCGWKGKRKGDAGTYEKQALVLVNHGMASGRDLLKLAEEITGDVEKRFGIRLEKEVNII